MYVLDHSSDMQCNPTKDRGCLEAENRLMHCISGKILSGVSYGLEFNVYHPEAALLELSTAQSLLLALFHSLLTQDLDHCSFLLRICNELQHLRASYLAVWLMDDFVFPCNDVARVINTLAHLTAEKRLVFPDHIIRVFTGLGRQYGVNNSCKTLHDQVTFDFMTGYDVPLTKDVGTATVCNEYVSQGYMRTYIYIKSIFKQ